VPGRVIVKELGRRDYRETLQAMQDFTAARSTVTPDELWLLEHPAVFTLGRGAQLDHLLSPGDIPVIRSDRGGQVTYHGPGQIVLYALVDIERRGRGIRSFVNVLERAVVTLLTDYGIEARARAEAPGVYVAERKIASLGLRIRKNRSYHGLSLNVAMDLEPFSRINPCGYAGLEVTQLCDLGGPRDTQYVGQALCRHLTGLLDYDTIDTYPAGTNPDRR
jgi:lipoyl(octanoyl) transferase